MEERRTADRLPGPAAALAATLTVAQAFPPPGAGAPGASPPPPAAGPGGRAAAPTAPRPPPSPASPGRADTLFLPRARTAPTLDCDVAEWPAEGRVSLSPGEPEVLAARGAGDPADATSRVHLTWKRDTLYVMADVRDDRVRPGAAGGGDWIRVEVGVSTVWVPAPGAEGSRARAGPRPVGEPVPAAICSTGYGWLAEAAVPAGRLGGALRMGELVGLQVLVEDPDADDEDPGPPYLRWSDAAVLAAPPAREAASADSLLARLREEVSMAELRARPGARDTAVEVAGEAVPGVRVEVGGVPAVAFPDPRGGGTVTYWLEGGEDSAADALGFHRTVAALHRQLGALREVEERDRSVFPEVRFELLPGVIFRLGDPGAGEGDVSRSALPTDVFVRSRGGG